MGSGAKASTKNNVNRKDDFLSKFFSFGHNSLGIVNEVIFYNREIPRCSSCTSLFTFRCFGAAASHPFNKPASVTLSGFFMCSDDITALVVSMKSSFRMNHHYELRSKVESIC